MIITIDNLKGGQGKSTLSLLVSLETGAGIITNDLYSPVDKALPAGRCIKMKPEDTDEKLKELDRKRTVILDFGGYADRRMLTAIQMANVVVVPTLNAFADLQVTIKTIQEIARHNRKILVVVNRAKSGDLEVVRNIIHGAVGEYPILPLKTSVVLSRLYKSPKPISQLVAESGLNAYMYGELNQQIQAIIKTIAVIAKS